MSKEELKKNFGNGGDPDKNEIEEDFSAETEFSIFLSLPTMSRKVTRLIEFQNEVQPESMRGDNDTDSKLEIVRVRHQIDKDELDALNQAAALRTQSIPPERRTKTLTKSRRPICTPAAE